MIICIDSGNSRLKWTIAHSASAQGSFSATQAPPWLAQGSIAQHDATQLTGLGETLAAVLRRHRGTVQRILIANVAGATVAANLRRALTPWQAAMHFLESQSEQAGVHNL